MMQQICYGEKEIDNKMIDNIFNIIINKSDKISEDLYKIIKN